MELYNNDADILMSYDSDIDFEFGDLMMAENFEFIKRKVFKLLLSEENDWRNTPNVGASPVSFIGEKNNRETAMRLQAHLTNRIQPFIQPYIVSVRVVPLNYDAVKIYIDILSAGRIVASLAFNMDFVNGFTYTQFDDRVDKVISSKRTQINSPIDMERPNPIKGRISRQ